jgi:aryl-alcohol dehydrogenase-like predicted oxidoreductase
MEYRHVGRSELVASAIGFGCRPLGGAFGPVSEADAIATIRQAMTVGINCFDTAPRYGFGRADELLGQALGRWRQEVTIITKVGYTWDPGDPERTAHRDGSRAAVLDGVGGLHASLRRLGTDYVDLLLVDALLTTPIEETMAALVGARDQGKVRHIGVANFKAEQVLAGLPHAPLIVNEVDYHLFDRRWEQEVFETCRMFGIGVLASATLASGLLTGALTAEMTCAETDPRRSEASSPDLFAPESFTQNLALVERLRSLARRHRASVAQLALAWVLHQPAVSVALVGMSHSSEVVENVGALNVRLTPDDLAEIETIMAAAAGVPDTLPA